MPEFTVQYVPISSIKPYENNPRLNDAAVAKIAASIQEFGWRQPIVVDENMVVIVGHARLKAARRLGLKEVPVHIAVGLSPGQVRAYRLADNRTRDDSLWDTDLLSRELYDIKNLDFPLEWTGFNTEELQALLEGGDSRGGNGGQSEDGADGLRLEVERRSRRGDLWKLGRHRIICAECGDSKAISRLMDSSKAGVMLFDPPVGWCGIATAWPESLPAKMELKSILTAAQSHLMPACAYYLWLPTLLLLLQVKEAGLTIVEDLVWLRARSSTEGQYHRRHIMFLYARREEAPPFLGDNQQNTAWEFPDEGAEKPPQLFMLPMMNHIREGEAVYGAFIGDGSALLAGQRCNRIYFGCDPDPNRIDLALAKWQRESGEMPERISRTK